MGYLIRNSIIACIIVGALAVLATPVFVFAEDEAGSSEVIFRARVIEIVEEKNAVLSDGTEVTQQKLKLVGLEGGMLGQEFLFDGTGDFDLVKKNLYRTGDKVLVVASPNEAGEINYYITDYVRSSSLFWLFMAFIITIIAVGGWKGFRSLVSLALTFLILVKFLIPRILAGDNPIMITVLSGLVILLVIIYVTEGFNKRSHVATGSIFASLLLTILLSWGFVALARLSGVATEEVAYIANIGGAVMNFKGLLLAGIIIGALGVLDDVVISQIAAVEEIMKTDSYQTRKEIFKKAYRIGVSHISSMTNTLFLAYAGVSLPLLVLFISGKSAFASYFQIINNEAIATEIVRTLAGSIGLILAVPISTILAVFSLKSK